MAGRLDGAVKRTTEKNLWYSEHVCGGQRGYSACQIPSFYQEVNLERYEC